MITNTPFIPFHLSILIMSLEGVIFWYFVVEETAASYWAYGLNSWIRSNLDGFKLDLILQSLELLYEINLINLNWLTTCPG